MEANIFDIKRFAVHDGDGIRTTVFFKGCPLSCVWCHNPEGIIFSSSLFYYKSKCTGCGKCVDACKYGAHRITDGIHSFARHLCNACGECENACLYDALSLSGKKITADVLLAMLTEDMDFYRNSGGGVTLSGGECLMQADFCRVILKRLKQKGIDTAVDTCGAVPWESFSKVSDFTDTFLYDIKAIDEALHTRCTGMSNKLILDNLIRLDELGKAIEIRVPYIPDYNDREIPKIADFLAPLKNVVMVRVLPYHDLARSKYDALDIPDTLPARLPSQAELAEARMQFSSRGIVCPE